MALQWGLTAAPAALAGLAAALYYGMTERKTRVKHSIAASYLLVSARERIREALRPDADGPAGVVRRACINGLLAGLGKRYFCVESRRLASALNAMLDDDPECLRDRPIASLLEDLRTDGGFADLLPPATDVALCEITLHYRFGEHPTEYVATWQFHGGDGLVHFPPYPADLLPAPRRIVSAFVVGAGDAAGPPTRRNVMDFLRPWLGPRGNFYVDLPEPLRPSMTHLMLLLRAHLRRKAVATAATAMLLLLDNRSRAYRYDLRSDALFAPPAQLFDPNERE